MNEEDVPTVIQTGGEDMDVQVHRQRLEDTINSMARIDVGLISRGGGLADNPYLLASVSDQVFEQPLRVIGEVRPERVASQWQVPLTRQEIDRLRQEGNRVDVRARLDSHFFRCDINTEGAVPPPTEAPDRIELAPRVKHIKDFAESVEGYILDAIMNVVAFAHPNATAAQHAKALAPLQERIATMAHILVTELTEMEIKIDGRKRKILLSDNELDRKLTAESEGRELARELTRGFADRASISLSPDNAEI